MAVAGVAPIDFPEWSGKDVSKEKLGRSDELIAKVAQGDMNAVTAWLEANTPQTTEGA